MNHKEKSSKKTDAIKKLEEIVTTNINDSAFFILKGETLTQKEIKKLNLLPITEITRDKSGNLEVKFHDKIKAAQLILEHNKDNKGSDIAKLYQAIADSVKESDNQ